MYFIEKNLNRLLHNQSTYFLDPNEQLELKRKIKQINYKIFNPYNDCEKKIFYVNKEPDILLYEIICNNNLRHQDILGAMYSLNISSEMFGDILLYNNKYYVFILKLFQNYFESNFNIIGKNHIKLLLCDLNILNNYKRDYEEHEIISSSERIDSVISKIIGCNRQIVKEKILSKDIILNYNVLKNHSYILKKEDIFSIKKYGKFKYFGIIKNTKKNNYIIRYFKYL